MHLTVAAPRNARQMLSHFALYDAAKGLQALLNHIDHSAMTRRQIFFSVLGRAPERAALAADGPNFKPRHAFAVALQGEEFQTRIREIVLAAFPEKRRMIFIHVPKCAGTDLLVTLRRQYPYLHQHIASPVQTPKPALFDWLRDLAIATGLSDRIAIAGHVPLKWYTDRSLVRFEDEVFTTIRHPRDIVYSYISFILTRFVEFQGVKRPDTSGWLAAIGLTEIEADPTPAYLADLGGQLLRARGAIAPNIICTHLGHGTAETTLENLVLCDVEVTDMARYSAWRAQKFGFEPANRVNPSRPLFTPELATAADRAFIEEMIAEDMVAYEAIVKKLDAQDGLSIPGRVFA